MQHEEDEREEVGGGVRSPQYQNPMHQYGSAIITLTDPANELHKMELTFRSAKPDADGNAVIIKGSKPLMNDHGIMSVIGVVQSLVSQVTVMSNLNKTEVPMLMDFLGDTLAKDLMVNRLEYGITSVSARDKIYFTALSTAFVTLKRAFEEGDKRFWKGSVQEIHSKVESSNKSRGMLSRILPWGNS